MLTKIYKKAFLILLICNFSILKAQTQPKKHITENEKKEIQNLYIESKLTQLYDSIKKIREDHLKEKTDWKIELLEERLKQASDTIANQNSFVSGFSVIYTIITLLIAIMAIVLPILIYQFGIKPSRLALKDLQKDLDKKLDEYLTINRNKQVDQAIENLSSDSPHLRGNAQSFIVLTQHQGFTEQHYFKLFKLLDSDLPEDTKISLSGVLSNKKSEYAKIYFEKLLDSDLKNISLGFTAIRYFVVFDPTNYLQKMRLILKKAEDKYSTFSTLMVQIVILKQNEVLKVLNDKELIDLLDTKTLEIIKTSQSGYQTNWRINAEEFNETYLAKKISLM